MKTNKLFIIFSTTKTLFSPQISLLNKMAASAAVASLTNGPNRETEESLRQMFIQNAGEVLRQLLPMIADGYGLAAIFLRSKASEAIKCGNLNHSFNDDFVTNIKTISDSQPQNQLTQQFLSVLLELHIRVHNRTPTSILLNPTLVSARYIVPVLVDNFEFSRNNSDVCTYLQSAAQAVVAVNVQEKPDQNTIPALVISRKLLKFDPVQQPIAEWIYGASQSNILLSDSDISSEVLTSMGSLFQTGSCGNQIPEGHATSLCEIAMKECNLSFLKEYGDFFGFSNNVIEGYIIRTMQLETPDTTLLSGSYEVIKIAIRYSSFLETLNNNEATYLAGLCSSSSPVAVAVIEGLFKRTGSAVDELFSDPLQNPIIAISSNLSTPMRTSCISSLDILIDVLNTAVSDNIGNCYVEFLSQLLIGQGNILGPSVPELEDWCSIIVNVLAAELTTDEIGNVADRAMPSLVNSMSICLDKIEYRKFIPRVLSSLAVCCERGTRTECQSLAVVLTKLLTQFSDPKIVVPSLECSAAVLVAGFEFSLLTKDGFQDYGLKQTATIAAQRGLHQSGDILPAAIGYYSHLMMADIGTIQNELTVVFSSVINVLEDIDSEDIHTGTRTAEITAINFISSFLSSASSEQFIQCAQTIIDIVMSLARHPYCKIATASVRSIERLLRMHSTKTSPWLSPVVDVLLFVMNSCINTPDKDQLASAACDCVDFLSDDMLPDKVLSPLAMLRRKLETQL